MMSIFSVFYRSSRFSGGDSSERPSEDAACIVRAVGVRKYGKAHELCTVHMKKLSDESRKADDAAHIAERLLAGDAVFDAGRAARFLKRKEAALE